MVLTLALPIIENFNLKFIEIEIGLASVFLHTFVWWMRSLMNFGH